jgi:hypothetical protein
MENCKNQQKQRTARDLASRAVSALEESAADQFSHLDAATPVHHHRNLKSTGAGQNVTIFSM